MGLIQYLDKVYYLDDDILEFKNNDKDVKIDNVIEIRKRVGMWHRAYAIDDYFQTISQENTNNIYISINELRELHSICKMVLEHKDNIEYCKMILPDTYSNLYDEWYFKNVENTIEMLDDAIKNHQDSDFLVDYVYDKWW